MLRAVIDTPVVAAGFLDPGWSPAHGLLEAQREGEFELISSPRLFAELAHVLERPALRALAPDDPQKFLERIAAATLFVAEPYDLPRLTADRHHDLLTAVAHAGRARFIVSTEDELLRSFVRGLTIVSPEEFLAGLDRVGQMLGNRF